MKIQLTERNFRWFLLAIIIGVLFIAIAEAGERPANLWKGLVAEDTAGDRETYLIIASVVRNRLNIGMTHGLNALKRPDLDGFVAEQCEYVSKKFNKDLKAITGKAINDVFIEGSDFSNGGTHYEHTQVYDKPWWAPGMKVVKILHKGTEKEITCYKKK